VGAKKIWVGMALVVTGVWLVSCGGMGSVTPPWVNTDSETEVRRLDETAAGADSNRSGPRGFQFESGFIAFGEFDPYTLGDSIFNPCTEITEEEFAAAGFNNKRHQTKPDAFNRGMTSCYFGETRSDGVTRGFSNGTLNRSVAEELGLVMDPRPSELLPEMYVLKPRGGNAGMCFTQIDTNRGGFGTQAGGSPSRITTDEACDMAIADLESLYESYGT